MYHSFEGDFRPGKPLVSLTGRSKNSSHNDVIRAAQEARENRKTERKQIESAIKIQASYRGYRHRTQLHSKFWINFDSLLNHASSKDISEDEKLRSTQYLLRGVVFNGRPSKDGPQILQFLSYVLLNKVFVSQQILTGTLEHCMKKLLVLTCKLLTHMTKSGNKKSHALPLRLLETFLDKSTFPSVDNPQILITRIAAFCVERGFFSDLLAFFNDRVPVDVEMINRSPLAQSLINLIMRPISLISQSHQAYSNVILLSLTRSMFVDKFSRQVSLLLIPSIAEEGFSLDIYLALLKQCLPSKPPQVSVINPLRKFSSIIQPTPWLLLALVSLAEQLLQSIKDPNVIVDYLEVLEILMLSLALPKPPALNYDSDDEETMEFVEGDTNLVIATSESEAIHLSCQILQKPNHTKLFHMAASNPLTQKRTIPSLCVLTYYILRREKGVIYQLELMSRLAYTPSFIRALWGHVLSLDVVLIGENTCSLLALLIRGVDISITNLHRIAPSIAVFSALFSHILLSLHDTEFYKMDADRDNRNLVSDMMPFSLSELIGICGTLRDVGVGIIKLAHPDTWTQINDDYKHILDKSRVSHLEELKLAKSEFQSTLVFVFKHLVGLIKQLHSRDSRHTFTPKNHWLADVAIDAEKLKQIYKSHQVVFQMETFTSSTFLDAQQMNQEEGLLLSNLDVKNLTILRELPFVVSFQERVKILQRIILYDRKDHQSEMGLNWGDQAIQISVRRGYLYEDAFEKLSPENEPNLKLRMKVQMQNAVGLEEAGVDGGGIFREFLNELLKEAFNPTRGFFVMTHDKLLYPNPLAHLVEPDFSRHYFFLGRMLGKAIYENMLVELPFAAFFLSKIFGQKGGDVDFHHLASLDPDIYSGLLYLRHYRGDFMEDLQLDFSLLVDEFGVPRRVDLKPGGKDIRVDSSNRIEYIHLVADFYLNRRIRQQCKAFYKGLADVVDLEWLKMFNYHEHQIIISGALLPVDISDLRSHTNYSGGYTDEHPVIQNFWNVVEQFDEHQRRYLLKFVTSCSNPPLLGFKDLYPAFCIHSGGADETRLPSAATCMNLLKLPEYTDLDSLRTKILYAIESGAGFELS